MPTKSKLSIEDQVQDLKEKGVTFALDYSEQDAASFLRYNNNYFKLKAYAKNYGKNIYNQYINLDFSYLVELSKIDMQLRRFILEMCLDLEHILKVQLISRVTKNSDEDGYSIVKKYFFAYPDRQNEIAAKASQYNICSDLVKKHIDTNEFAAWHITELLSFGKFIEFYELYGQEYHEPDYHSYLKSVKFLRNAAAHSNCIINSLTIPKNICKFEPSKQLISAVTDFLRKYDSSVDRPKNITIYMSNPIIHDFVALLFVYVEVVGTYSANKSMLEKQIDSITGYFIGDDAKIKRHKEYFQKKEDIRQIYIFIASILCGFKKYIDTPRRRRPSLLKKS